MFFKISHAIVLACLYVGAMKASLTDFSRLVSAYLSKWLIAQKVLPNRLWATTTDHRFILSCKCLWSGLGEYGISIFFIYFLDYWVSRLETGDWQGGLTPPPLFQNPSNLVWGLYINIKRVPRTSFRGLVGLERWGGSFWKAQKRILSFKFRPACFHTLLFNKCTLIKATPYWQESLASYWYIKHWIKYLILFHHHLTLD
jgi:hypothetical protein